MVLFVSLVSRRWMFPQIRRRRLLSPEVEALLALRRRYRWSLSVKAFGVWLCVFREREALCYGFWVLL